MMWFRRNPEPVPTEETPMDDMPAPLHDPRRVGQYVIDRLGDRFVDSGLLGHMVWLCDGWHMAIEGQRLCDARAIATSTGPNYDEIVDDGHSRGVHHMLGIVHTVPARLTSRQREIVHRVLAKYGRMTRSELGRCVRSPSGVWMRTLMAGWNGEITSEAMGAEFLKLARLGREATAAASAAA